MKHWIAGALIICIMVLALSGCKKAEEEFGVTGSSGTLNTPPSFQEEMEQEGQEEQAPSDQPQEQQPQQQEQEQKPSVTPDTPEAPKEETPDTDAQEKDPNAEFIADESGTKIKILCQNLRIDSSDERGSDNDIRVRRHRFKWLVDKYDPDVVGMQEVDDTWMEYLPVDFSGEYTIYYFGRDEGGVGEGTPVMWKTAKYKKIRTGAFWLSDSPLVYSPSYDSGGPRIVNWVTLQDRETKVQFTIYSTHYGFYKSNDAYKKIRQQMVRAFNERPGYSFWMGDFNIGLKNKSYYTMVDYDKIYDLWDLAEAMKTDGHCTVGEFKNGSYSGFSKPEGHGTYGDFIWARQSDRMAVDHFQYCYEMPAVEEQGVGAGYVSDHFAVYAEVRVDTDLSYADYYKLVREQNIH